MRDENTVFAEYRGAEGPAREALERELVSLLFRHALALTYLRLGRSHPHFANLIVWRALQNAHRYEGRNGAKFSTWFHQLARNMCETKWRERYRRPKEVELGSVPPPSAEPVRVDARMELERLAEDLEPHDRELLARKLEGATPEEISRDLGETANVVNVRWHRLKRKLKEKLK